MIAIRGATTVVKDTPAEIKSAVGELLRETVKSNDLTDGEIVCIMFSNTTDIKSFYPAKAAREAGFYSCPLFSSLEPEISGSLPLCIRIMILAETNRRPVPVYLRGAAALRKDISQNYNIAIDGPAGSGKSTISKILGKKLNILYLDTGAMYRACALKCIEQGVAPGDVAAVEKIIESIDIKVKHSAEGQITMLDGKDVSGLIRTPRISMLASTISALGCVRQKMVDLQRQIAKSCPCILDGRDIGTNVLPDAQFKFYLTASPEVRAQRRLKENTEKGIVCSYDDILADIIKRDTQDKTRKIAPLKAAADAVVVDTSQMSVEEVVEFIENKIQEKI